MNVLGLYFADVINQFRALSLFAMLVAFVLGFFCFSKWLETYDACLRSRARLCFVLTVVFALLLGFSPSKETARLLFGGL